MEASAPAYSTCNSWGCDCPPDKLSRTSSVKNKLAVWPLWVTRLIWPASTISLNSGHWTRFCDPDCPIMAVVNNSTATMA